MRVFLLLLTLLPGLVLADPGDAPPISLHDQLALLLFPLGVAILTVIIVIWDRRRRQR
jgi:hypothetical protein